MDSRRTLPAEYTPETEDGAAGVWFRVGQLKGASGTQTLRAAETSQGPTGRAKLSRGVARPEIRGYSAKWTSFCSPGENPFESSRPSSQSSDHVSCVPVLGHNSADRPILHRLKAVLAIGRHR